MGGFDTGQCGNGGLDDAVLSVRGHRQLIILAGIGDNDGTLIIVCCFAIIQCRSSCQNSCIIQRDSSSIGQSSGRSRQRSATGDIDVCTLAVRGSGREREARACGCIVHVDGCAFTVGQSLSCNERTCVGEDGSRLLGGVTVHSCRCNGCFAGIHERACVGQCRRDGQVSVHSHRAGVGQAVHRISCGRCGFSSHSQRSFVCDVCRGQVVSNRTIQGVFTCQGQLAGSGYINRKVRQCTFYIFQQIECRGIPTCRATIYAVVLGHISHSIFPILVAGNIKSFGNFEIVIIDREVNRAAGGRCSSCFQFEATTCRLQYLLRHALVGIDVIADTVRVCAVRQQDVCIEALTGFQFLATLDGEDDGRGSPGLRHKITSHHKFISSLAIVTYHSLFCIQVIVCSQDCSTTNLVFPVRPVPGSSSLQSSESRRNDLCGRSKRAARSCILKHNTLDSHRFRGFLQRDVDAHIVINGFEADGQLVFCSILNAGKRHCRRNHEVVGHQVSRGVGRIHFLAVCQGCRERPIADMLLVIRRIEHIQALADSGGRRECHGSGLFAFFDGFRRLERVVGQHIRPSRICKQQSAQHIVIFPIRLSAAQRAIFIRVKADTGSSLVRTFAGQDGDIHLLATQINTRGVFNKVLVSTCGKSRCSENG